MNYKKQVKISLLISVFITVIAFVITSFPTEIGFCRNIYANSGYLMGSNCLVGMNIFSILFFFSSTTFFSLIPLYFLKEGVYLSWKKFALWYIPIVAIILLISPQSGGGGFNPGYGFDQESLTFFFSGLFAVISLILITYKSIKLRGK